MKGFDKDSTSIIHHTQSLQSAIYIQREGKRHTEGRRQKTDTVVGLAIMTDVCYMSDDNDDDFMMDDDIDDDDVVDSGDDDDFDDAPNTISKTTTTKSSSSNKNVLKETTNKASSSANKEKRTKAVEETYQKLTPHEVSIHACSRAVLY